MEKREKLLAVLFYFVVLAVVSAFALVVNAATEATVTATVTAQNIAVTVTDGSIAYGTLGIGTSTNTTTGGNNDSQTAVNTGNITQGFNIRGQNSVGWTLTASPGSNQYTHQFCITNCDASPSWTALTTSNQTLFTSKAVGSSNPFDLQIKAPSSTTDYTQQSVDVTVVAVAS
jgi:hypothetical protein